jgi:ApaG protein
MIVPQLYQQVSHGIRVTVRPVYAPEHSDPAAPQHVFVYYIRIENLGERTVQLLTRHWQIHDSEAGDSEVDGPGVVGEQPVLAPGDVHEYNSFCVLRGTDGWMAGTYHFRRTDGTEFDAAIPRFFLRTEL